MTINMKTKMMKKTGTPVSGAQQLPLPQLHAHAGTGQVDELNEGHQSAAERRHAQSFEARALSEVGTMLWVRGVGRVVGDVQGEGGGVAGARLACGCAGAKGGGSVSLGPIVA